MSGIPARTRQVSLSMAGILILVLAVGPACVPQQLRADAASRIAGLAESLDTALAGVLHSAFSFPGSGKPPGGSASHNGGSSQLGAPLVLAGGEIPPSPAGRDLIDTNGLGTVSFNAESGAGSAWKSAAALMGDMPKDGDLATGGDFAAFAGGGNDAGGSLGAGNQHSSGIGGASTGGASAGGKSTGGASTGVPSTGDAAQPTLSHSSSIHDITPPDPAPPQNSDGTLRRVVARPDGYQDQNTGLGNDVVSVYDDAGASGNSLDGLLTGQSGGSDGSSGPHDGGTGDASDSTTGNFLGQSLNGAENPPHGGDLGGSHGGDLGASLGGDLAGSQGGDLAGSIFINNSEVNGGTDSNGGDANGPQAGGSGPFNDLQAPDFSSVQDITNDPPNAATPEPSTLLLLGTVLLGIGLFVRRTITS